MKRLNLKLMLIATLALLPVACDKAEDKKEADIVEANAADVSKTKEEMAKVSQEYLDENGKKEGVIVTESGLQYEILIVGTGPVPTADDFAEVHYAGRLLDGTEFDSSYARGEPATFPVGRLIPGWVEALQLMPTGSKWRLTIPSDIAYGDREAGPIPANSVLVFEMELLSIKSAEQAEAEEREQAEKWIAEFTTKQRAFLEENTKAEGVVTTDSGLQYKIITEGTGAKPAGPSSQVTVHYAGQLIDGNEFDSSYKRGEPASFALNQVISGWTEGLQLMSEGAKYKFFIPGNLGYGPNGSRTIPPNATLVFDVELISVED